MRWVTRERTGRASVWASRGVTAAVALLVLLSALPAARVGAVVTLAAVSAVAPLVGLVRYRPARRLPWFLTAAMLTGWTAMVGTAPPRLAVAGQVLAAVCTLGLIALVVTQRRRPGRTPRPRSRREDWGRRVDQLVVGVVSVLALSQAARTLVSPDSPTSSWWAPVDVVLVCLVLRVAASRAQLGRSIQLLLTGAVLAGTYFGFTADSGGPLVGVDAPLAVFWALAMALIALAAVHPTMAAAFDPATLGRMRPESGRVLGLVPFVLVPGVLSGLQPAGRLPTSVYLAAGGLIAGLIVLRGAQSLQTSEERARRDPLTGLANRRGLAEVFDTLVLQAPDDAAVISRLVVLDLDDFKHVNDTYGHETGDQLLVAVGRRLAAAVGRHGTVARSGGDEFVLLLDPEAPPVADVLGSAFQDTVVLHNGLHDQAFTVRASSGWVELTAASDLPLALADADVALYASKDTARGTTTLFDPRQRATVLGQLALAADLRALVAGQPGVGHLLLHYQPLVALPDRTVLGCEALLRWAHPTRGLLGPDEFLPAAEAQGHGAALDSWVLERACRVAAGWDGARQDWTVAVNLGRSSMVDPHLGLRVTTALASAGLPAHRLHLEITEHDQLPIDAGVDVLHGLAALGVRISLDDFGTGYTSLAHLQRYPVTVLKLDRSITGLDASPDLLAGVVALAAALKITVLAEGVESDEQRARLAELGIGQGQGWLFGRPVPADQLSEGAPHPTRVPADLLGGGH